MKYARMLLVVAAISVASCARLSDWQADCESRTDDFGLMVACLDARVTNNYRANKHALARAYMSTARELSERVRNGQMSEAEARTKLAQQYAYLSGLERGRATVEPVDLDSAGTQIPEDPQQPKKASLPSGYVFERGDFVDLSVSFDPSSRLHKEISKYSRTPPTYTQRGAVDGQPFTYYRDGSGSFGPKTSDDYGDDVWHTSCSVDKMDDTRSCFMWKGDLRVYRSDRGLTLVFVGRKHFPGTGVKVRLDGGKPIAAGEDGWAGPAADALVDRLLQAQSLTTRYQEWPYRRYVDKTVAMDGFALAWRYINWAVNPQS